MKLYDYFRSSAAFRVRIALNLKGVNYEQVPVNLRDAEHNGAEYRAVNPQRLIPTLVDGEHTLTQSLAICEYLDEVCPEPSLLPGDPLARARVRALAQTVACDMHPLNNSRVLVYLRQVLEVDEAAHDRWYQHWIAEGFSGFEALISEHAGGAQFCHGGAPTLADVCLVPQVFNARRFDCDLAPYPNLMRVFDACMQLQAFERARPEHQPGAL